MDKHTQSHRRTVIRTYIHMQTSQGLRPLPIRPCASVATLALIHSLSNGRKKWIVSHCGYMQTSDDRHISFSRSPRPHIRTHWTMQASAWKMKGRGTYNKGTNSKYREFIYKVFKDYTNALIFTITKINKVTQTHTQAQKDNPPTYRPTPIHIKIHNRILLHTAKCLSMYVYVY